MFEPLWILAVLLGYMGMLFVLAQWASKRAAAKGYKHSPLIYSLSIGVFCTSWTFYGSVGSAANNGILFLSIYFGPTLVMLFAGIVLWAYLPRNKKRFEEDANIIFKDDGSGV